MSIGYVLLNIDRKDGTPSTKLGPLMGMESRSLTRTLKTMEEQGLIYRRPDKYDRRMVRVFLTELGEEKRDISRRTVLAFNERLLDVLPEQEYQQFLSTMQKINQVLEEPEFFAQTQTK